MSTSTFSHLEKALAQRLGLSHQKIREVRSAELERGRDWAHVRGAVHYSDEGLARLCSALQVSPPAPPETSRVAAEVEQPAATAAAPAEAEAASAAAVHGDGAPGASGSPHPSEKSAAAAPLCPGDERELVVVRAYSMNRHIVLARLGDTEARVRVRDNRKLRAGMVMRCTFVERDLWDIAQRLPRHPGKW